MRGEGVSHCEKRIQSDGGYLNYDLNVFKGCEFRRIEEEKIVTKPYDLKHTTKWKSGRRILDNIGPVCKLKLVELERNLKKFEYTETSSNECKADQSKALISS